MNCIVTAGPTYEELDKVRRLTNFSTGTLGCQLANYLVQRGHRVQLLLGHYATCRLACRAQRQQVFTTSADLRRRLRALAARRPDALFHAAAVSDFRFGKLWVKTKSGRLARLRSPKISSGGQTVLAQLLPAPKIIARLRHWFPKAALVGWKFELDATRSQAIARAHRQMVENRTDLCVVNGKAYGPGFGLAAADGSCAHFATRRQLFAALQKFLRQREKEPAANER